MPTTRIIDALVWFHRWLGVVTCLIFAAWFVSGAVLLFQPFPSLPQAVARGMAPPIDMASVRIAPLQALRQVQGDVTALELIQRGEAPAYIGLENGASQVIDARSGVRAARLDARQARAIGEGAVGGRIDTVSGPFDYDQWIVHNQFDSKRPFFRLDLGDDAGTQLYLSAVTGEIVQRTTRRERGWNWVGAVLHWAYFTPLRSSFTAWDQSVWWLSFVSMWVAVVGIVLGILRTLAVRRAGRPGLTFFRLKWMRWHHLLGLFASIFVLTWILSGWLSMDHGRIFSRGSANVQQHERYGGLSLESALAEIDIPRLRSLPSARVISFRALGGQPIVALTDARGVDAPYDAAGAPLSPAAVDRTIRKAISDAWPGGPVGSGLKVPPTDTYALAEGMPASARRYVTGDGTADIYVDGNTGTIITVMDSSRAAYAWIYYVLHTFNFPGLTTRPLLREAIVLIPLIFGFAFSLTGVVLGFQRLRKTRPRKAIQIQPPTGKFV